MINRDSIKKILQFILFTTMIVIVFSYSFFSFKDYIDGPIITISEPENGSTIATSTVEIKGKVLHTQEVSLNNKILLIDTQGNFKETILLSPDYNVALISAKDKFKRTIEYKLELVYQDKN
jgi:hypothetical protein